MQTIIPEITSYWFTFTHLYNTLFIPSANFSSVVFELIKTYKIIVVGTQTLQMLMKGREGKVIRWGVRIDDHRTATGQVEHLYPSGQLGYWNDHNSKMTMS